jgi:hypothetical protein
MKSITYWNRLEPRARSRDTLGSLQARVRDPLWFLTRQWQMGEFRGEDAASPAWVQMAWRHGPFTQWAPRGGPNQPLPETVPLEELTQGEAFTEHLALKVELGQLAEELLTAAGASTAIPAIRGAYPIPLPTEAALAAHPDAGEARMLRIVGERCSDGVALGRAAGLSAPGLPAVLTAGPFAIPPGVEAATRAALDELLAYVTKVYGRIGNIDADAWRADRLEYDVDIVARDPSGDVVTFDAEPSSDGAYDWYAFDVRSRRAATPSDGVSGVVSATTSVLPMHVRFRGMPNHRWWDFESAHTDFGQVAPDTRDVGRLLAIDFMTVAGNDWLVAPLVMPVGTVCEVELVLVHDVFGGRTMVPRANDMTASSTRRWAMYAHTDGDHLASCFAITPTAVNALQPGSVLEEVRFIRDEMANMVWAIEHTIQGGTGEGVPGHEYALADEQVDDATPEHGGPRLFYQLETLVPAHWIPMLPVAIDPIRGDIALERGAVARARDDGTIFTLPPRGRILRPTGVSPYHVREEEVTRAGTRVTRYPARARWWDGSTHLWMTRRTAVGMGEGSSGLRYDLARARMESTP